MIKTGIRCLRRDLVQSCRSFSPRMDHNFNHENTRATTWESGRSRRGEIQEKGSSHLYFEEKGRGRHRGGWPICVVLALNFISLQWASLMYKVEIRNPQQDSWLVSPPLFLIFKAVSICYVLWMTSLLCHRDVWFLLGNLTFHRILIA